MGMDALPTDSGMTAGVPVVPDRPYFKIGEVSEITGLEQHVIRYWEAEFKEIKPQRTSAKQRMYRKVDVEFFLIIKKLLYEDGFKIPGAKKFLADQKQLAQVQKEKNTEDLLFYREVKSDLLEIKKMLE